MSQVKNCRSWPYIQQNESKTWYHHSYCRLHECYIIGIHALTGCDTVSAFAGEEKSKALHLLMKQILDFFKELGINWTLTEHYHSQIEFLYAIYMENKWTISMSRGTYYIAQKVQKQPNVRY